MGFTPTDTTTLTAVSTNLDIGDIADPALRLASFQYLYGKFTELIAALNASTGTSGADNLGSTLVSGVSGTNVRAQITDLRAQILALVGGAIPPQTITTAMIQDLAITFAKHDTLTQTDLNGGLIYAYKNIGGAF
jgi:hypothetical protein